jgi:N,N-dimethylformamidase
VNRIVGYTDRASVEAGGEITCHVGLLSESNAAEAEYRAEIVRVLGWDEARGSERIEPVASGIDGRYVARVESTSTGSYGTAAIALAGPAGDGLTVEVTFMPTLFGGREQGLISICEAGAGGLEELALTLDAARRPVLIVGSAGSGVSRLVLPTAVAAGHWYRMTGGFNAGGAFAAVTAVDDPDFAGVDHAGPIDFVPEMKSPTAYFACRPSIGAEGLRLESMFTGRLEQPGVATAAARSGDGWSGVPAPADTDALLALWDFGRGSASFRVHDASGNGNDGELFGLPMRSVTGSNWDRRTASAADAPDQYRAIHFFADAIEDAGWPAAFSLRVPADLRSGLYAFVLRSEEDVDTVPFVVSPSPSSRAELLLILPTATYLAYSNARWMWERVNWEVQRERTVALGRGEQILVDHPEFGASSYDQYRDGTNIAYVSWRRPNLDMRAGQCRGESYPSDLRLIDWLERRDYRYDICTDGDLDQAGSGLLESYRVAITGTHPEYGSSRSCAALESFVSAGGRLAVLGGDVYGWRVAFSSERPWIMEVRKSDNVLDESREASERRLAFTGELSGEPYAPPPSARFLGTSTASMGFDAPRPYERLPASDSPEARFVFEGVAGRVIGDQSREGGVVFQEWDNTEEVTGFVLGNGKPIALARSSAHSVATRWFGAVKRRNHAEMTFFTTGRGGAVFSAGSMAWCLCLHNSDVSLITSNVIDRFLDPAPFDERLSKRR